MSDVKISTAGVPEGGYDINVSASDYEEAMRYIGRELPAHAADHETLNQISDAVEGAGNVNIYSDGNRVVVTVENPDGSLAWQGDSTAPPGTDTSDPPVEEPDETQPAEECGFSCKAGQWATAGLGAAYSVWSTVKDAALSIDPHVVADIAGAIPIVGEPIDAIHAGVYTYQGEYLDAALTAISLIPAVGDLIGKGAKYAIKAGGAALDAWWHALHRFGGVARINQWLDKLFPGKSDAMKRAFGELVETAERKLLDEYPGAEVGTIRGNIPVGARSAPGWPDLPASKTPTFSSVDPEYLEPGTKLYRVYGGPAGQKGAYWTKTPPQSTEAGWRGSNAVRESWNTGERVAVMEVGPEGMRVWSGPAAPQHVTDGTGHLLDGLHYPGQEMQVYVPRGQSGVIVDDYGTPWSNR